MLTTVLLTVIILFICIALLAIKVIFKNGGRFPNTHIDGNRALRKKGIHCARTQDRELSLQRNLYDRLKEKE